MSRWARAGWAAATWLVLVATGWGLWAAAVTTSSGQRLDQAAKTALLGSTSRGWQAGERVLDLVEVPLLAVACGVVLVVGLLRRQPLVAVLAAGVVPGAAMTTRRVRYLLPRPDLADGVLDINTLPSGHTTAVAAVWVASLLVAGTRLRPWLALLGVPVVSVAGTTTVVVGMHRPADVLAGVVVATGWGAAACAVAAVTGRSDERLDRQPGRTTTRAVAGLLIAAGAVAAALALAGARGTDRLAVAAAASVLGAGCLGGGALVLLGSACLPSWRPRGAPGPAVVADGGRSGVDAGP